MDCRTSRQQHLHGPWPSAIEELQAAYAAGWEIYRELLDGGKHGDWVAKRLRPAEDGTNEIRATSVDTLAQQLEAEAEGAADV